MSATTQKLNIKVVAVGSNQSSLNSGMKAPLIVILKYLDIRYYENKLCYMVLS